MLRSWPTRPAVRSPVSGSMNPGPNGMTRNVITAARNTTTGAHVNTILSAFVGVKSSFMRTLRPATTEWSEPPGPTRFGPTRRFISAMTFSSM